MLQAFRKRSSSPWRCNYFKKCVSSSSISASATESPQGGGNEILLRSLYRTLMRQGRWFDENPLIKAVIPFPLPFSWQVLLGGHNRDFFTGNASLTEAIQEGFRDSRHLHRQSDFSNEMRIDLALQLQVQLSKWQHLFLAEENNNHHYASTCCISSSSSPTTAICQSYEERYQEERANDQTLNKALEVLEEAQEKLKNGSDDRKEIIKLYEESIRIKPTADAHTFLGYLLSYDGHFQEAKRQCHRAIELDPGFGNAYNDLGLGDENPQAALPYFEASKEKPRYEARYKAFLNCGHLYLEEGHAAKAMFEYLQALNLVGPESGREIRAVVCDMARILTQ